MHNLISFLQINLYGSNISNILCIPSMLTSHLTVFLPELCVFIHDLCVKMNYCVVDLNYVCVCVCVCECVCVAVVVNVCMKLLWSSNFEYKAEEKPSVESTN